MAEHHKQAAAKQVIVPEAMKDGYENFKFAPAFDQIEMVLKEAGASWTDVVDVTSYAVDLDRDLGPMWAVKEQRVPAPYPALDGHWYNPAVRRGCGAD